MADLCVACRLPLDRHQGLQEIAEGCVIAQSEAMKKLLNLVGQPGACRGCERPVWWVTHNNGAKTPYDSSGLNHFVSCPKAKEFKR